MGAVRIETDMGQTLEASVLFVVARILRMQAISYRFESHGGFHGTTLVGHTKHAVTVSRTAGARDLIGVRLVW